jgi:DNA-binding transcriptional regulator YiaG
MLDPETLRDSGPFIRSPLEIKELRNELGRSGDDFPKALNIHLDTVGECESTSLRTNRFPAMVSFRLM